MEPSFRTIAELFQVPIEAEPADVRSPRRPKEGQDADESRELGREALSEGDYRKAIEHFRRAVEQRDDAAAHLDLGAAYEYADDAPRAFRQYEIARRAHDDPDARLGLAGLLQREGRFRDAARQIERAIDMSPKDPVLRQRIAQTLRDAGERRAAYDASLAAVYLKPDEPFYHYWLGDLLLEMRRDVEALDALRAAIELSPGDDHLYLRASVGMWRLGRKPEAVKAVRLASDLDPDKTLYHGLLSALLAASGLTEEAALEKEPAAKMDLYDRDLLARLLDEIGLEP